MPFDAYDFNGKPSNYVYYAANYASIQAAIDALPSVGGTVCLAPNTTYTLTTGINTTKTNVRLWAQSWNTIVKRDATLTSSELVRLQGAGSVAEGFTVDGNSVVHTSAELAIDGADALAERMQVINSAGAIHLRLAGVNSAAINNTITGLGTSNGVETGYGIWAINHVSVRILGNRIRGTSIDGIGFDGDDSIVIGNNITDCHNDTIGSGGGQICYYGQSGNQANGAILAHNTIKGGGPEASGLEINGGNVLVDGNTINGVPGYGINIQGTAVGKVITNNIVLNIGSGNPGATDAIAIQANVGGIVLDGNRVIDDQATVTLRDCIGIAAGTSDDIIIVNNQLTTRATRQIRDSSSGTNKVIKNNTGIDNILGTIASSATLTLPQNPLIVLSGSATVTVIAGEVWNNRDLTIFPTGAVVFTAGATIGNTVTCVANEMRTAKWLNGKLYLK